MDVTRSSTFTVLYGGRSLLTPSYFLMRWTYKDTGVATYCICTNIGNDAGPILLQVTETGAVTPDPFSGEVQLANGNYQLETWEQTSASNLFPPEEDPEFSELIDVEPADIPTPPPVDPCLGCPTECLTLCELLEESEDPITYSACIPDEYAPAVGNQMILRDSYTPDLIVEGLGNAGKTDGVRDLICPDCDDATVQLNGFEVATVKAGATVDIPVLQNGSPVGSWNGTQWIVPACPSGSTGNYWRAIALGT